MCVPEGLLPFVGWWCWCVGGVLPGALPLVVWRVGDVVWWCQCMCAHEGLLPPLWVGGVGVLVVCCLGGVAPLWFSGVGCCPIVDHTYS